MFDALNGIERRYMPIHVTPNAPRGASRRAAVIEAACTAPLALYPAQQSTLQTKRDAALAAIVDDPEDVEDSVSIARGVGGGQQ